MVFATVQNARPSGGTHPRCIIVCIAVNERDPRELGWQPVYTFDKTYFTKKWFEVSQSGENICTESKKTAARKHGVSCSDLWTCLHGGMRCFKSTSDYWGFFFNETLYLRCSHILAPWQPVPHSSVIRTWISELNAEISYVLYCPGSCEVPFTVASTSGWEFSWLQGALQCAEVSFSVIGEKGNLHWLGTKEDHLLKHFFVPFV